MTGSRSAGAAPRGSFRDRLGSRSHGQAFKGCLGFLRRACCSSSMGQLLQDFDGLGSADPLQDLDCSEVTQRFGRARCVERIKELFNSSPLLRRRMVSERVVFVLAAQASISRINSCDIRVPTKGSVPVAGRPLFLRLTDIERAINNVMLKMRGEGKGAGPPNQ